MPQTKGHQLVMDSLRDTKAHCTCEGWYYCATFTNRDTDEQIRRQVRESFRWHLLAAKQSARLCS